MIYTSFAGILRSAEKLTSRAVMAVASAGDPHTLQAALEARRKGIANPVFVGERDAVLSLLEGSGENVPEDDLIDASDPAEAAAKAVALVREGRASFLLKGNLETGTLLRAVVDRETGLGRGRLMSHFTVFEVPGYHKLLAPVDGGMVPYPTLEQKKQIIENTVEMFHALGYECPKVGVLACVEKLNPKMPETVEADALRQMNLRGELAGCIVEGPISYDCAVSKAIADYKGFDSPCAGDCDILLAPNIHAGNIMGKMLTVTCGAKMAGFIVGAECPIAMTSRGSSAEEKFDSIVLAALCADGMRRLQG